MNSVQVKTTCRTLVAVGSAAALLSGCAATAPTGPSCPQPAGCADGTKTINTPGLTFESTSKGVAYDASGATGLVDFPVVFQTTSDPDVIIATVNGQNITLTDNGLGFIGGNATYAIIADKGLVSGDFQVVVGTYDVAGPGSNGTAGFYAAGLQTDPAQITALGNGTLGYTGQTILAIDHGGNKSVGAGTVALSANLATGMVSGTMTINDDGSDSGFEITNGAVITVNPAAISGNSFAGTWSATAADLSMTSIGTTNIAGNFYGENAFDIGGSFNGSGVSADGTTPAYITGGFLGD